MTGFDWPFQEARIAGDTGRVRDLLTTSPVIFGNASVAVEMHVLPASARPYSVTSSAAETADIVKARIRPFPSVRSKLEHRKPGKSIGASRDVALTAD
jgi:hypothetical protein